MSAAPLASLGRYRIVAELGRGAMGIVYRAEDSMLNRTVAIKTILLSEDADERAAYEARFLQEAKAAGGLNHPNIITVHDIGREGDVVFMAMELLEGAELRSLIAGGGLSLPRTLNIAAQVADGLSHAHRHGVVHRDIKPANIMVMEEDRAKIMDFGIARLRLSDVKTQAGSVLGSPKYMSPEQIGGRRTDHRSDIFSLGVVLYEMAVGSAPFTGADLAQLIQRISTLQARPPSSLKDSLPTLLDLIVARALEKDPDKRYQDGRELAADLRAAGAGDSYEKTLKVEPAGAYEKTLKVEPGGASGAPEGFSAATTVKSPAFEAVTAAGLRLLPARRFDSSAALQRVADPAIATGAAAGTPMRGSLERLLADPAQRYLAAAVAIALAAAVLIAFV